MYITLFNKKCVWMFGFTNLSFSRCEIKLLFPSASDFFAPIPFLVVLPCNFLFPFHWIRSSGCFHFRFFAIPTGTIKAANAKINVCCCWHNAACALPLHQAVRSLHRIISFACKVAKVETTWSKRNDSIANPPTLFFLLFFFYFFFYLSQRGTDSAARISAINYEGGRPKGIAREERWEKGEGRREKEREKERRRRSREAEKEKRTADGSSLCTQFPRGRGPASGGIFARK